MAKTKFKGAPVNTSGALPRIGCKAKDFLLTDGELKDITIDEFKGKKILMNIFPSIDTGVCAASVRNFNKEASKLKNTVVLGISRDLPFALSRFCGAEGIDKVYTLSELRNRDFGKSYGLEMLDGPLAGLLARAVIIVDTDGKVIYRELVEDITQEPNYKAAISALS